jgi:dihydroorotate dehydrogenase
LTNQKDLNIGKDKSRDNQNHYKSYNRKLQEMVSNFSNSNLSSPNKSMNYGESIPIIEKKTGPVSKLTLEEYDN